MTGSWGRESAEGKQADFSRNNITEKTQKKKDQESEAAKQDGFRWRTERRNEWQVTTSRRRKQDDRHLQIKEEVTFMKRTKTRKTENDSEVMTYWAAEPRDVISEDSLSSKGTLRGEYTVTDGGSNIYEKTNCKKPNSDSRVYEGSWIMKESREKK